MNLLKKVYNKFFDNAYFSQKVSYAQCGEDLIIDFLFTWVLHINKPAYLDIGAHHPHNFNNTYLFYKKGCRGVNIEPDPLLFAHFDKMRSRDVNINKGVGFKNGINLADFYIMSSKALNTFSKEVAEEITQESEISIEEIKQIPLVGINDLMQQYFKEIPPDLLSLDVEGLDHDILKSLDFNRWSPKVICVETILFTEQRIIQKHQPIIDFLLDKGYFCYADTSINSIFVLKALFNAIK